MDGTENNDRRVIYYATNQYNLKTIRECDYELLVSLDTNLSIKEEDQIKQ